MKVIVVVALFAFVAVQLCQAAPRPDDDRKEAPATADSSPAAPPAPAAAPSASAAPAAAAATPEVKSEGPGDATPILDATKAPEKVESKAE